MRIHPAAEHAVTDQNVAQGTMNFVPDGAAEATACCARTLFIAVGHAVLPFSLDFWR
jgi:hypothetical protein